MLPVCTGICSPFSTEHENITITHFLQGPISPLQLILCPSVKWRQYLGSKWDENSEGNNRSWRESAFKGSENTRGSRLLRIVALSPGRSILTLCLFIYFNRGGAGGNLLHRDIFEWYWIHYVAGYLVYILWSWSSFWLSL